MYLFCIFEMTITFQILLFMRCIAIIILLFFYHVIVYAQNTEMFTISGVVRSAMTSKPIEGAVIKFAESKLVQTDSLGRFTISSTSIGKLRLQFAVLGYPTKDTLINVMSPNVDLVWIITFPCEKYSKSQALLDIGNHKPGLVVIGGAAPPVISRSDKKFRKRYGVGYDILGCELQDYTDCIEEYNKTIIEYLDANFGLKWRKSVRKDIVGL